MNAHHRIFRLDYYYSPAIMARRVLPVPRNLFQTQPVAHWQPVLIEPNVPRNPWVAGAVTWSTNGAIQAITSFDLMAAPHMLGWTWGDLRRLAIRYWYPIATNRLSDELRNFTLLTGKSGSRAQRCMHCTAKNMLAIIVHKAAYGVTVALARASTLGGQGALAVNQEKHLCFVLPLIDLFVQSLDARNIVTVEDILEIDVGRTEESIVKKKRDWGVWSKTYMSLQIVQPVMGPLGTPNPLHLTIRNQHDCKGVEYTFARIMEQLSQPFYKQVAGYEPYVMERTLRSTTAVERAAFRTHYDHANGVMVLHRG
jgi:hypothetical protein